MGGSYPLGFQKRCTLEIVSPQGLVLERCVHSSKTEKLWEEQWLEVGGRGSSLP